jgi:uncharacterized membrane protein YccC
MVAHASPGQPSPFARLLRLRDRISIPEYLTLDKWIFSAKAFAAAMLALFVALWLDFEQPGWSVTTVYVVSQPLSGMVLSKATYRALGTVAGATASLVFVGLFAQTYELFLPALALWIGAGAFVTAYFRDTPQAYIGTLAGFTAAVIGLPAALAPETAFDLAVSRTEEILLGIGCGTLIHHVVAPRTAGAMLERALRVAIERMASVSGTVLNTTPGGVRPRDLQTLITSIFEVDALRRFALLDTPSAKRADLHIQLIRNRLFSLLALLVSLGDRFAALQIGHASLAAVAEPAMRDAAVSIRALRARDAPPAAVHDLARYPARLPDVAQLKRDHDQFLLRTILLRTGDTVRAWQEILDIESQIRREIPMTEFDENIDLHRFRDLPLAITSAAVAAVAVLAASAFWIATAWPTGPTAVTFTAVICTIMAGRDMPAKRAADFLIMSIAGAIIAAIYVFIVLPPLQTFGELMLALSPFYLTCGLMLGTPRLLPFAMPMIFNGGALLGLANIMNYDFAAFLNTTFGYVVGIAIGAAALLLLHPSHPLRTIRLTASAIRRDLRDLADPAAPPRTRGWFETRSFDRINAVLPILDAADAADRHLVFGGLASLRIGLNLLVVRRLRPLLPTTELSSVDDALRILRDFLSAGGDWRSIEGRLLQIELALAERIVDDSDEPRLNAVQALHTVRTALAQHRRLFDGGQQSHAAGLAA